MSMAPQEAFAATYSPFQVGEAWGARGDTTWFRLRGQVPPGWAGREVVALMRLTNQVAEGFTADRHAGGGESFEFFIEAASNGGASPGGEVAGELLLPEPGGRSTSSGSTTPAACFPSSGI